MLRNAGLISPRLILIFFSTCNFSISFPVSCFPFPVFCLLVSNFLFPVSCFLFPVSCFLFPVSYSFPGFWFLVPGLVSCFLFPVSVRFLFPVSSFWSIFRVSCELVEPECPHQVGSKKTLFRLKKNPSSSGQKPCIL